MFRRKNPQATAAAPLKCNIHNVVVEDPPVLVFGVAGPANTIFNVVAVLSVVKNLLDLKLS